MFDLDGKYVSDSHITALRYDLEKIHKFYLLYFFVNFGFKKLESMAEGTGGQIELSMDLVKNISIPIPKDFDNYTSYKIQEIIVEFLEYNFDRIKRERKNIDGKYKLYEKLKKSLIPSTFIKDYVKVTFGRYAKENDIGFNITDVEFDIKKLNEISNITMGQSPKGKFLNMNNQGKPFYQGKTNFGQVFLEAPTRWTTDSKREAKKDDILISLRAPAGVVNISNMDISIGRGLASIQVYNEIENFYIFYFLKNNEVKISNENDKGGFFTSMNKDYLYDLEVPIPKSFQAYTSLEIQKIIVDFIKYTENRLEKEFDKMNNCKDILTSLHETYLSRTFTLIKWSKN